MGSVLLSSIPTLAATTVATGPLDFAPQHGVGRAHLAPAASGADGGNWSGYVATGSGFTTVRTTSAVPTATCNSTNDLYAMWVGIDGYGSQSVEQTGIVTDCSSGRPVYRGFHQMYPDPPVYYNDPISGGDSFRAWVVRTGTTYTLTLFNDTKGWKESVDKAYQGANASAEVILESPTQSYPNFGKATFVGTVFNDAGLAAYHPVALDATGGGGAQDHTGAISDGDTFTVTYLRE
ncbi:MAG: hypothetical protein JOZ47_18855 [Kutzneria sp.]|nr:hypothetical protein [Kutzneria sp.]